MLHSTVRGGLSLQIQSCSRREYAICTTMPSSRRKDENGLPPVKKGGIPLWVFRLIRCLLCLCPFDAYVMFPLMILMGIAVLGIVASFANKEEGRLAYWIPMGVLAFLFMALWLKWARTHPRVPQEDDVAKFSIRDETCPRAPVAPLRGELVAKGDSWFKDELGRRMLLRGINLQSGTKLPFYPEDQRGTHLANENFENYGSVSFVGRPFPLEEADLHLCRLRAMGLTFLRFLVTWEAIEHEAPNVYDLEYLDYLKKLVQKCNAHGLSLFIDLHQDVWSRWTGGDGAPGWTLEKVGFALDKLDDSAAAITHQKWKEGEFPKMVWNSNNSRLAAGTMWTLFFAGNDFAPKTKIDGVPVQEYLQSHFIAAMAMVAKTLKDEPNVVGFDILNEPSVGFVGVKDARDIGPNSYFVGYRVDPWSAMKMGAGETCTVNFFSSFMLYDGKRKLNTDNVCAWKNGPESCVWLDNGVWKMNENGKPQLLKPFHFATNPNTGEPIEFVHDYGVPFWLDAAKAIREHMPDAIIFAEPILDMTDPSKEEFPMLTDEQVGAGYVWASHYYDGMTLMTKTFSRYAGLDSVTQRPSIGMDSIANSYGKGIAVSKKEAGSMGTGGCPVLIGECGIPFDMGAEGLRNPLFFRDRKKRAAFQTGDFSMCTNALNRTMEALDVAQVSYTIWCYNPDNTNKDGDGWNGEDLSLFSRDQCVPGEEDDLFNGGRSLLAAIRPYPQKVAGDVDRFSFQLYRKNRRFDLVFNADQSLATKETVIFLPKYQYPHGVDVRIKKGEGSYEIDWDLQTLTYTHSEESTVNHLVITKLPHPTPSEGGAPDLGLQPVQ